MNKKPFSAPPYNALSKHNQSILPADEYQKNLSAYQNDETISWDQITYRVHAETVVGFIVTPKNLDPNKKYPVIFYNRGGSGDSGKINLREYPMFKYFIKNGYIVFASQYRGVDGGTGTDNFGGNDIHDVLELIKVAQHEPYVDAHNMFMFGWSRGGMMTYLALRGNVPINAAATSGGITDLALCVAEWKGGAASLKKELSNYIPGFQDDSVSLFECVTRSAVCFADEIKTPLLVMHGNSDQDIRINQANLFEASLQQARCVHKMFRFDGGHPIPLHHLNVVIDWFEKYKK